MKKLFADSVYWIALLNSRDSLHKIAVEITKDLGQTQIVSTDVVLTEVLNQFSSSGIKWRTFIVKEVKELLRHNGVVIFPSSRSLFIEGLRLYESRLDKEYSHVDCMSMVVMKNDNITDVLTNDHHFEQEGFKTLLK